MLADQIRLCRSPIDVDWNLRSAGTPSAEVGVLDWQETQPAIDGGVPQDIARVICEAFCRLVQLSFLDSSSQDCLQPAGLGRWLGRPVFRITTTTQTDVAVRLFDDSQFPWEQSGQFVVCSDHNSKPNFQYPDIHRLWSETTPDLRNLADNLRANGFMLAGPDGDFAEIVSFSPTFWPQFEQSLMEACLASGYQLAADGELNRSRE
jgi:hypothetical protein